jgi:Uma2 family endonuclease
MLSCAEEFPSMPAESVRRMSIDEFMAMRDSVGYELVQGVLTSRKETGALGSHIAARIAGHLGAFVEGHAAGHLFGAKTTYCCFESESTGRRGNVSFISRARLTGEQIPLSYIEIPADVIVEVISPNDLAVEVEEKVKLYLRNGFGEVWVVYPETRTVYVYRKGHPVLALEGDEELTGRGALAGFSCPVSRFFPALRPATSPGT